MAENKKRSIQFRRNISQIYATREAVKAAIEGNKTTYLDGEQIFGRYYYTEDGEQKIATLVGLVHVSSTGVVAITYSDPRGIEEASASKSIVGGKVNDVDITMSASTLGTTFSVTISGDNVPVGDNYDVIEYNSAFTATTAVEVAKTDSVDAAINKVEKSVAALVDEVLYNEKVTSEALIKHNESCGFDENGEYTAATADKHYIGSSTNLTDAVEILDGVVYNISGKVDSISASTSGNTTQIQNIINSVGLSGNTSGDTIGYSAHTTPTFITVQNPTTIQKEIVAIEKVITPTTNTDATIASTSAGTNSHKNIIKVTSAGTEAFADLHYDETTNTLKFVNTNGYNDIKLAGINFISGASYNAEKEEIDIYYQKAGETSASTLAIPVSGIITEYKGQVSGQTVTAEDNAVTYNGEASVTWSGETNVTLITKRTENGFSRLYGDITTFDCGTY